MAVYDLDQSSDSRALIEAYNSAGYFLVTHTISSLDELERLIEDGDVRVGLLIPPVYSNSLQTGQPAEIAAIGLTGHEKRHRSISCLLRQRCERN